MGKRGKKSDKESTPSSLAKGMKEPGAPGSDSPPDGAKPTKDEFIIELSFESDTKDENLTVIPVKTVIIGPNDPPMVEIPEPTKEMQDNNLKVDIVRPRVFKRVI